MSEADNFDVERIVVGANWFTKLFKKAAKVAVAAGQAYLQVQAKDGSKVNATPDALGKAAEMIAKARGGDAAERQKIEATADLAVRGDPAAKQASTLFSVVNDYAKIEEAKAKGAAAAEIYQPMKDGPGAAKIGSEFDVEQMYGAPQADVPAPGAAYDWEWPDAEAAVDVDADGSGGEEPGIVEQG